MRQFERGCLNINSFDFFTCSWEFKCSCLNLNSFFKVFLFVHFVHLVHLFSRIWKRLSISQFIWLGIWVCSLCSPCLLCSLCSLCALCSLCSPWWFKWGSLKEAVWISIHLIRYLSWFTLFTLLTLFILFTCSQEFEWSFLDLISFY